MRLSDFAPEKGFEVAAKAFPLIMQLRENPKTVEAWGKVIKGISEERQKAKEASEKAEQAGNEEIAETTEERNSRNTEKLLYEYYSTMLINERDAAIALFALLNDVDVANFKYNAATLLVDMITAFAYDATLMELFIPQIPKKKAPSSGSALENMAGADK